MTDYLDSSWSLSSSLPSTCTQVLLGSGSHSYPQEPLRNLLELREFLSPSARDSCEDHSDPDSEPSSLKRRCSTFFLWNPCLHCHHQSPLGLVGLVVVAGVLFERHQSCLRASIVEQAVPESGREYDLTA